MPWSLPDLAAVGTQERVYAGADETVQTALARLNLLREDEGGADVGGRVRALRSLCSEPCRLPMLGHFASLWALLAVSIGHGVHLEPCWLPALAMHVNIGLVMATTLTVVTC